jgi:hypothetical protein
LDDQPNPVTPQPYEIARERRSPLSMWMRGQTGQQAKNYCAEQEGTS